MNRILPTIAAALVGICLSFAAHAQGSWSSVQSVPVAGMTNGKMFYQYLLLNYTGTGTRSPMLVYEHENSEGDKCYPNNPGACAQLTAPLASGGSGVQDWYNTAGFQSRYCANGCVVVSVAADQTSDPSGQTSNFGGYADTPGSEPNERGVIAVIQALISQLFVDPNRIYVTGDSLGGIGSQAIALDYGIKTGTQGQIITATMPFSGGVFRNNQNSPTNQQLAQIQGGGLQLNVNGSGDTATSSNPALWTEPVWRAITNNSTYPGPPAGGAAGSSPYHLLLATTLGHDVWDTYRPMPTGTPLLDLLFAQTSGGSGGGTLTGTPQSPLPSGFLNTVGNQIQDGSGNNVRLACTGYDRPTGNINSDMAAMRAQGFNCVRVPWYDKITCPSGTCNFAAFDGIVSAATANSMRVIFDHHGNEGVNGTSSCINQQSNGLWYDLNGAAPWTATNGTDGCGTTGTVTYARFRADWLAFATHYSGNTTVIGFDLHHEPTTFGNAACCSAGGGGGGTLPTAPAPAASVGYNTLTFGPSLTLGKTPDPATSYPQFTTGVNLVPFTFFGTSWLSIGAIQNGDGSVTMDGTGQTFGNGLSTAEVGTGTPGRLNFLGQSFGGGFYVEAEMKGNGPMSFWANDIETMNGSSQGLGPVQWPGQAAGYGDWLEPDIAEFDTTGNYGWAFHNWYNSTSDVAPNWGGPLNNFNGPPAGVDFTAYHKYGALWVPATNTAPGYMQYYFDGQAISNKMQWNKYNSALAPPPVAGAVGNVRPGPFSSNTIGDTAPNSAWSVLDTRHLAFILGGSPGNTVTFRSISVWQADGSGDLPVIATTGGGGSGGGSGTGTGNFVITGGHIVDPNGLSYVPVGINIDDNELTMAAPNPAGQAQPITTLFPGINHIRLRTNPTSNEGLSSAVYPNPAIFDTFVNAMTALHIVVEIEDHACNGGVWEPGQGGLANQNCALPQPGNPALTPITQFYTNLGNHFKTNPYVWFGSMNEPSSSDGTYNTAAIATVSTYQQAIYNAVRATGAANIMQMLAGIGGGNCGTVGAAGGFIPSIYASMTGIVWELHGYYNDGTLSRNSNYTNATDFIAGQTAAQCGGAGGSGYIGAQTIQSADGIVPVIYGEWGSADGNSSNGNASQMAAGMIAAATNRGVGNTGWAWFPSPAWQMVNNGFTNGGPFSLTTWGAQQANVIKQVAPLSGIGGAGTTTGANWGGSNGGDMKTMVEDVGAAVQAAAPGSLIIVEGIFNNGSLFNGTARGSAGLPITSGSIADLSTISTRPVVCCSGHVLYSVHDMPTSVFAVAPDSGPSATTMRNTAWGYLETTNRAPVWVGKMGASLDNTNGQVSDETAWATSLTQYLNGQLGGQGGPTFTGCNQPMGGDWWDFGNNAGLSPDGTLNADGSSRAGQKTYWSPMLYTTCSTQNTGGGGGGGGGGGTPTATAWNPLDASAGITLTLGNLKAAINATGSNSVRSTTSQSSGKVCFDIAATSISPNWDVGITSASFVLNVGGGLGVDTNGIGFDPNSTGGNQGIFFNNGILSSSATTPSVTGDVTTICADLPNKLLWATSSAMRAASKPWNNSATADPALGNGGMSFAGMSCPCFITFNANEPAAAGTLNPTGPFAVATPSGFSPWQLPVAAGGHPFFLIFGANDNLPFANENEAPGAFAQPVNLQ